MTDPRPDPLVPSEVDLRGYEFMPFFGDRCFGSESWIRASNDARVAMLKLWWRCYSKEVPAGSLPNDDALLCDYAGYGGFPKAWRKVRDQAMAGFVLCSDGRLYHKVVGPLAIEAWEFRNKQRNRTQKARIARLSQNNPTQQKPSVTDSTGQDRTGQDSKPKQGIPGANTPPPAESPAPPLSATPAEPPKATAGAPPPDPTPTAAGAMAKELRIRGLSVTSQHPTLLAWIADGYTLPSVIEAFEVAQQRKPGEKISANYVDPILRNPPKKAEPAWWRDQASITAKAKAHGIDLYGLTTDQAIAKIREAEKKAA